MSNFEIILDTFSKKIPTRSEYTQDLWRPFFHTLTKEDREKFVFMCRFADAYHSTENMIAHNQYSISKVKSNYQEVFTQDGQLKGYLPETIDHEALKTKLLTIQENNQQKLDQLNADRASMIETQIATLKKVLSALNHELTRHGLSYTEHDDEALYATHGDVILTDLKTDKKHRFNFNE